MFAMLSEYPLQFAAAAVLCYLFGAVNYSVLLSRTFKKSDIRRHGSGNAGTTNMFRVYGLPLGFTTFVLDAGKGVLSCLAVTLIFRTFCDASVTVFAGYFAGLFAVTGHIFPVFYKFRGGKGFATTIGILFFMQPILMLCMLLPLAIIILLFDRMSIAALSMAVFSVIWHWTVLLPKVGVESCVVFSVIAALIVFAHRHNIKRLVTGKELPTGVRKALRRKK